MIYNAVESVHPPHSRDPSSRLARAKRGFTCLGVVESARRMRVDIRSICFRQSDTRVDVDARVTNWSCPWHGSHYRALSIRGFNYAYSQRMPIPFHETGASQEMDFQYRDVAQYSKGGLRNMSRARAWILHDDKSYAMRQTWDVSAVKIWFAL